MVTFCSQGEFDRDVKAKLGPAEFNRRVALHLEIQEDLKGLDYENEDEAFACLAFYGTRFRWMLLSLNRENADRFAALDCHLRMHAVDQFIRKGILA